MKRIFTIVVALCVALPMFAAEPAAFTANQPMANPQSVVEEEDDTYEWEFWWEAGFDLASNYMWRGYDQSYTGNMFDPSFQPSLTLGYGKFYINLWGNASLLSDYKEFDMFLGFDHENLSVTIYDVFCGVGADFGAQSFFDKEAHNLTATIDYTFFDRLRLHWATTFLHAADRLPNGKRAFSSYFEVGYTQPFGEVMDMEIIAGAAPWTGPFWMAGPRVMVDGAYMLDFDNQPQGFNVTNLSVVLTREFDVNGVGIPVELGYTFNPTTKRHYALVKAGFAF
ncbi:MAG: hypothetical protein IIW97_02795 [Alistipes sp.]|nr:hypothetical protein [Alistipes sp.]